MSSLPPLATSDLDEILTATAPVWEQIRGQSLFLTGGTGFFGTWLLESFLHANHARNLNAKVTVLTRNPAAFATKSPHLTSSPAVTLLAGDIRTFAFPPGEFPFLIHAATEASAALVASHPAEMLSTIVEGTQHVLRFAAQAGTRKFLLTSSGAVYGRQPIDLAHIPDDYSGAPDPLAPASVYGEGKRVAELLCCLAARATLEVKIARCFAFLGPHLPLDTHFAAGNFLADALAGRPISIAGDGRALRSYLYASDLATWLWTLLFKAPSARAYNVGSEHAISIRELAYTAARAVNPHLPVTIAGQPTNEPPPRYIPSTRRAQDELNLRETVPLAEAFRRTLAWHQLESTGTST